MIENNIQAKKFHDIRIRLSDEDYKKIKKIVCFLRYNNMVDFVRTKIREEVINETKN
jgi:hypothetical protein